MRRRGPTKNSMDFETRSTVFGRKGTTTELRIRGGHSYGGQLLGSLHTDQDNWRAGTGARECLAFAQAACGISPCVAGRHVRSSSRAASGLRPCANGRDNFAEGAGEQSGEVTCGTE